MKILIVDDEEMMRQVVKDFIVSEGIHAEQDIYLASNGLEGIAEYSRVGADIVISDMMMPKMGGAEMISKIREMNSECEFLVMTAYADIEMALSVIRVGAFELLRKPFEPKEINLCLAKIIDKMAMKRENQEYREKLVQAEKFSSLGLLSAGIAHEINNPNTFVKGNLELLLKYAEVLRPELEKLAEIPGPSQAKIKLVKDTIIDTIKSAVNGTERISKIVNGLTTFSRKSTSTAVPVQAAQLWQEAMTLTSHRLKHHEVVMDFPEKLSPIVVDIQEVVQVFMNLLVNAVDAIESKIQKKLQAEPLKPGTPNPKGRVTLTGRDDLPRNEQVLAIRDSGTGMDEKTMEKIFLPFFTTKGQKGTGLGLSISKGAIEAQKGTIQVSSKIGEYTEFEIRFPLGKGV